MLSDRQNREIICSLPANLRWKLVGDAMQIQAKTSSEKKVNTISRYRATRMPAR